MWSEGTIKVGNSVFHYWVKHYDEPSHYGIGNGRISKLTLKRNGMVVYELRPWRGHQGNRQRHGDGIGDSDKGLQLKNSSPARLLLVHMTA